MDEHTVIEFHGGPDNKSMFSAWDNMCGEGRSVAMLNIDDPDHERLLRNWQRKVNPGALFTKIPEA